MLPDYSVNHVPGLYPQQNPFRSLASLHQRFGAPEPGSARPSGQPAHTEAMPGPLAC